MEGDKAKRRRDPSDTNVAKKYRSRAHSKPKDHNYPILQLKKSSGDRKLAKKFLDANFAIEAGEYDRALELLQEVLNEKPDFPGGWINLALCHNRKGAYDLALSDLAKAEALGGEFPELYLNRAVAYRNLKQYDEAERELKKLLALAPQDPDVRLDLSNVLLDTGRNQEAIDLVYEHVKLFPTDIHSISHYFWTALNTDLSKELLRVLPLILLNNKKNITWMRQSLSSLSQSKHSRLGDLLMRELLSYAQKGDFVDEVVLIQVELAMNALNRGEFKVADDLLQDAEAIARKEIFVTELGFVLNARATVYDATHQFDNAMKFYKEALEQADLSGDPKLQAYVLNNIGNLMKELGDNDKAEVLYQNLIELCEERHDEEGLMFAYNHLAEIFIAQNSFKEALDLAIKALVIARKREKTSEITRSLFLLARLDAAQLDFERAKRQLDLAEANVSQQGNELDLFQFLLQKTRLLQETKDLEGARKVIGETIKLLASWMERGQNAEEFNLDAIQSKLNEELATISAILNDPSTPLEEKSQLTFLMKRFCEIVVNNPEKLEDPSVKSQLPGFLRELLKEKINLHEQVSNLTQANKDIDDQLNELRKKLKEKPSREECEKFWVAFVGKTLWDWLNPADQEELLFSYLCGLLGKTDLRFNRVALKYMAIAVENELSTRLRPLLKKFQSDFPKFSNFNDKNTKKTLETLNNCIRYGNNIYLGSIPYVFNPLYDQTNPLNTEKFFERLRGIFQPTLSQVKKLVTLIQEPVSGDRDARPYSECRNMDAHRAGYQCPEPLLTSFQDRTREILVQISAIFN